MTHSQTHRASPSSTSNLPVEFLSRSAAETEAFAAGVASQASPGQVFALVGPLGAGKTAFARGFARGLGIRDPVSSPTFTLVKDYSFKHDLRLWHMDLYRIADSAEALAFGVDEILGAEDALCLVEWPERIADILPPNTKVVRIALGQRDDDRLLSVSHSEKIT